MVIAQRGDGLFFALDRHSTCWVAAPEEATQFASGAAYAQCVATGRLRRHRTRPVLVSASSSGPTVTRASGTASARQYAAALRR